MQRQNQQKRKFSVILRDPHEIAHRKGINSIAVVNQDALDKVRNDQVTLFTASRDRLIKLWNIGYESRI